MAETQSHGKIIKYAIVCHIFLYWFLRFITIIADRSIICHKVNIFIYNKQIYFHMDGKILKKKLQLLDIQLNEVAKRLDISPQNLQNRFKSKEITLDFLIEISKAVNVSVYYFIKGTIYENDFLQPDNHTLKEPESEFLINKGSVVDAKNQTIEILEREVEDLRNDKDFLKKIIDAKIEFGKNTDSASDN